MVDIVPHFEELATHRNQIRAMQREVDNIMLRMNHIEEEMLERKGKRAMLIWVGCILVAVVNVFAWSWSCGTAFHISF